MTMNETRYGLRVDLSVPFDTAVARATDALKTQGFGVITTIDIAQTLKQKLNRDFRRYVILGACNPVLAHKALLAEPQIGLMLPCNVVVQAAEGGSTVSIADPKAMFTVVSNPTLVEVANDADARLRRVIAAL